MKTLKLLFCLLPLCFDPAAFWAQGQDILWFNQVPIDKKYGLTSGEYNYYAYQDSEGFVWISSTTGLNRFDGQRVRQYRFDPKNPTTIYGENIQSPFFEDQNQNLWFSTYEALICYDRKADNFRHYFAKDEFGEPIKKGYTVFYLEDNLLWFKVNNNVCTVDVRYPEEINEVFETEYFHNFAGLGKNGKVQYIVSLENKEKGFDFVEIKKGLVNTQKNFQYVDQVTKDSIKFHEAIIEDLNNIWLTSSIGLIKWDGISETFQLIKRKNAKYSSLSRLGDEHFLITYGKDGLFKFNKKDFSFLLFVLTSASNPYGSENINLRNISSDRQGNIWMTNHPNGLIYGNPKKTKFDAIFKNALPEIKEDYSFHNFIEYHDGNVWCSHDRGILIYNNKKELVKDFKDWQIHPDAGMINYILIDQSGKVWAATSKGLSFYDQTKEIFSPVQVTEDSAFLYLYQLKNEKILASTSKGIFEIIQDQDKVSLQKVSAIKTASTSIYEDQLGQIYICDDEAGIKIYTMEADSFIIKSSLSIFGEINSFFEAGNDTTLWIGSSFGLAKINKNHPNTILHQFSIKDSFPDNSIRAIVPKNENELWISTNNGLINFNTTKHSVKNYTLEDGTLSEQFKKYASLKLSNGDIWLGGSNGITIIPERLTKNIDSKVEIIFTEFKINDEMAEELACEETQSTNLNQLQSIELPYQNNTFSLSFRATDYAAPMNTQTKYRLEGVDKGWIFSEKGATAFARYPNLQPGKYRFQIQGANSDGQWNYTRNLAINIPPPYWMTWWFKGLIMLSVAILLLAFIMNRVNQARKTSELKARIAENKISALVAQMNPHFIFNSLQSINSYILKNDKQKASEYLGRFSKLMRMILENSRHSAHVLQQEIELLSLYLKVEAQRFKTPFEYNITIDETVDPYEFLIPSMLLQPFIENAIWHGISNKTTGGHVKVGISRETNNLKCVIEDNGVGRAKAAEIKSQKGPSHTSRALEIITERLQLLYPDQQHLCAIDYIDLYDKEKKPAGTRVEIRLPLMEA